MNKKILKRKAPLNRQPEITYEELNNLILSLNTQQRKILNAVQEWRRKKIKAMNSTKRVSIEPVRLFITAGAGVGKSHFMKTISMFLTITMNLSSE